MSGRVDCRRADDEHFSRGRARHVSLGSVPLDTGALKILRRSSCANAVGRGGESVEVAVELTVCDCALLGRVESDGERSAEPDCGKCDVGRGDSRWNPLIAVRGVD